MTVAFDEAQALINVLGLKCEGCGSTKSLAFMRANGHQSCCPERKMRPAAPTSAATDSGEAVAWAWELEVNMHGAGHTYFASEKPVFSPSDKPLVRNLRPLYAHPSPVPEAAPSGTPSVSELTNELWEAMFAGTKDRVPASLTDTALAMGAKALLTGYTITRRLAP